jgi:hypothetical protein
MRLAMAAFTAGGDFAKVANARSTEINGVGVQDFIPDATLWQTKFEVVMRVPSEVHDHGNAVALVVVSQK